MFMREGSQLRAQQTVAALDSLNRILTDEESALLERSLRKLGRKRDIWRWSAKEDRKLILLIKKRSHSLRPKPFERNDEVQRIAKEMGRSYLSVLKRIERLRKKLGLAPQPRVFVPIARQERAYKPKDAPDLRGLVTASAALLILQKRCPDVSRHILQRWRSLGGGPRFIAFRGRAEWCGVWYFEKALAKFPVEQIMDEAQSRARGWLVSTMRMDPECPNAILGQKG